MHVALYILIGAGVGVLASFAGLGGGFLLVPLLLLLGFAHGKAVGTAFVAILMVSSASLITHGKLDHVDWKLGALLGFGGIAGAVLGSHLVDHVSQALFRKILGGILLGLALWLLIGQAPAKS